MCGYMSTWELGVTALAILLKHAPVLSAGHTPVLDIPVLASGHIPLWTEYQT